MLFTDQTVTLTGTVTEFTGKTAPERVLISGNTTYNFTLADNAAAGDATVSVIITGTVGELLDVFAGSSTGTGFKVKQVTLDTSPKTVTLKLAIGKWFVGVGPQMPKGPMGGPPPAPSYIMPRPLDIIVVTSTTFIENSGTANNGTLAFTLASADKSIQGLVKDGAGKVLMAESLEEAVVAISAKVRVISTVTGSGSVVMALLSESVALISCAFPPTGFEFEVDRTLLVCFA